MPHVKALGCVAARWVYIVEGSVRREVVEQTSASHSRPWIQVRTLARSREAAEVVLWMPPCRPGGASLHVIPMEPTAPVTSASLHNQLRYPPNPTLELARARCDVAGRDSDSPDGGVRGCGCGFCGSSSTVAARGAAQAGCGCRRRSPIDRSAPGSAGRRSTSSPLLQGAEPLGEDLVLVGGGTNSEAVEKQRHGRFDRDGEQRQLGWDQRSRRRRGGSAIPFQRVGAEQRRHDQRHRIASRFRAVAAAPRLEHEQEQHGVER